MNYELLSAALNTIAVQHNSDLGHKVLTSINRSMEPPFHSVNGSLSAGPRARRLLCEANSCDTTRWVEGTNIVNMHMKSKQRRTYTQAQTLILIHQAYVHMMI